MFLWHLATLIKNKSTTLIVLIIKAMSRNGSVTTGIAIAVT